MPPEHEVFANLTEGELRWYELWTTHIGQLDQKAGVVVTLDGILLALTASFLSSALTLSFLEIPRVFFAASTVLVLLSAAACTRVISVRFFWFQTTG